MCGHLLSKCNHLNLLAGDVDLLFLFSFIYFSKNVYVYVGFFLMKLQSSGSGIDINVRSSKSKINESSRNYLSGFAVGVSHTMQTGCTSLLSDVL